MSDLICLLRYRIRSMLKYPLDIILGILGTILWHMPNFILLTVVFDNVDKLDFSKGYLILLYGLSVFGDGIQHTFTEALWQFGNSFIKTARFDGVTTKPVSNFIQVVTSRFDFDGVGGVIWGGFCCFYGFNMLDVFSLINVTMIIMAMICAAAFFVGINVWTSATAFLIFDNFYITHTVFQLHMFARFPKRIYPRLLGNVLTFIIPIFLATYYPANVVSDYSIMKMILMLLLSIFFLISSIVGWNYLSRYYRSAGS